MNQEKKFAKQLIAKLLEDRNAVLPAFLGNLSGTVPADSSGNVYVTLPYGEVRVVYNGKVPNISRLPVLIGKEGGDKTHVIASRDVFVTQPYSDVGPHGHFHSFGGPDQTPIYGEQFIPGLATPKTGTTIKLYGSAYHLNGWKVFQSQDVDLSASVPASGALYALVEINEAGAITVNAGTAVGTPGELDYGDIPAVSAGKYPLFAVKLYVGQTTIIFEDLVDLRWGRYVEPLATSIHNATEKTTPVNADEFGFWDSVAQAFKKVTWANIKATLKAYFDTLYTALGLGGTGELQWEVDGALAVSDPCAVPILITQPTTLASVYIYAEDPGTAGNTTVDIDLNGGGSILSAPLSLAWNDVNGWASAVPATTAFVEGDILTPSITGVATGAAGLRIVLQPESVDSTGVTIKDVSVTVSVTNVNEMIVPDHSLTDNGGGSVSLSFGMVLLDEQTASSSAQLAFTGIPTADFDEIIFDLINIVPATDAVDLYCQMSTNNGSSYDGTNKYAGGILAFNEGVSVTAGFAIGSPTSSVKFRNSSTISNNASYGVDGSCRLMKPGSSIYKRFVYDLWYLSTGSSLSTAKGSWAYQNTSAVDAIKFYFSSGNIASGVIRMYGVYKQ